MKRAEEKGCVCWRMDLAQVHYQHLKWYWCDWLKPVFAAQKGCETRFSKQRSYPTPLNCEILQPCPASYAPGKCWQLIWGASFGVQFGSGKTWQQLVSITFVGQPVGHTSPNIVDFWGEGNKDGVEMLGNISNVFFWGGIMRRVSTCLLCSVLYFNIKSLVWKELEFKVGFQHPSKETRLSALYPTSIRSKTYLGTWFVLIRFLLDLKIRISIPNLGNRSPP